MFCNHKKEIEKLNRKVDNLYEALGARHFPFSEITRIYYGQENNELSNLIKSMHEEEVAPIDKKNK
jgi:hypothetical protein